MKFNQKPHKPDLRVWTGGTIEQSLTLMLCIIANTRPLEDMCESRYSKHIFSLHLHTRIQDV